MNGISPAELRIEEGHLSVKLWILLYDEKAQRQISWYNVHRDVRDNGNIVVTDTSVHKVTWDWEVKGGKWNVTYLFTYPEEWYEGMATFINCSNVLNGKEQPYVSWGSSKNWESNAIPIYANAWDISYNGDVFGFIPTEYGKYIFRVFTRNKSHNPFKSEKLILPESCYLQSYDKAQVKMWWADIKRKNCPESAFAWSWVTKLGKWRVMYKWISETEKTLASVFYQVHGKNEDNIINWEIDGKGNSVGYKANPVRIKGEPAWNIDLNPSEHFGFFPTGQGKWIIQLFSRNLMLHALFD
nr:uncharacterized protein LOC106689870 isoform X1 [Halyomorpha halys]XP_024214551.1 uncharacterized protein LOC106689870 isoform X1 [Halyomorpha halys]